MKWGAHTVVVLAIVSPTVPSWKPYNTSRLLSLGDEITWRLAVLTTETAFVCVAVMSDTVNSKKILGLSSKTSLIIKEKTSS